MNWRTALSWSFAFFVCTSSMLPLPGAHAAVDPASTLDAIQRDRLRSKLQTLFNEQDLMVRNQRADRNDVAHQQREFEALKVFQRIPFRDDLPGLKSGLGDSAAERGLRIVEFRALPRPGRKPTAIPAFVYTDTARYRLSEDQIAERIPFRAVIEGEKEKILAWMRDWTDNPLRLVEAEGADPARALKKLRSKPKERWEVRAHAFRFREVKFPSLRPREPLALLPAWAAADADSFARQEPMLWSFVTRIQDVSPRAFPLYRIREELLLNEARMGFFTSKAVRRPRH